MCRLTTLSVFVGFILALTACNSTGDAVLKINVSSLTLAVNDTALSVTLTGNPRTITITNTGDATAQDVNYSVSPVTTSISSITPLSCGDIVGSGTCVLTITPAATASAAPGNTSPTPITLNITGANSNNLSAKITILTLGSVYQSGYVFDIDDSLADFPATGSIGGKVAALTDQAPASPGGIIWSSNGTAGTSADAANNDITGVTEASTSGAGSCAGATDGACDTAAIIAYYSPPTTSPAVSLSFYAAGLCNATIGGFSDWYVPSICELGYDPTTAGSGCGSQLTPTLQNMQSNLVDNGNIGALSSFYWSSVEGSADPTNDAWAQDFATGSGSAQSAPSKSNQFALRCVRAITQ